MSGKIISPKVQKQGKNLKWAQSPIRKGVFHIMKKNKLMRLASGLLVAVLITTSTISGTYAKYVTSDSAEDTARVAKFGVVVTADGALFGEMYKDEIVTEESAATVVSSEADVNVVAPGTKNEDGMTFTVTGQPEVDVKLTVDVTAAKDIFLNNGVYADMTTGDAEDKFTVNETAGKYYPVKFTLVQTNDQGTTTLVDKGTIAAVETALNREVVYQANENLADKVGTFVLTWAWDFGEADAPATIADKCDTLLGDMAADATLMAKFAGNRFYPMAEGQEYCKDVAFGVTITVEQID